MRATTQVLDTQQAIVRPVAFEVIRRLGKLLRLPASTEILYPGPSDQASQSGSTLDYQGQPTKLAGSGRVEVEISESDSDSAPLTENTLQEEAPEIFFDRDILVRLRAIYATTKMTFTFNIRAQQRTEADKLRQEFRTRCSMSRGPILHTVGYHYGVPEEFQTLLRDIYAMRENVAGYGDTFEEWFSAHASQRLLRLPESEQWAFGERQTAVYGRWDFDIAPEDPVRSEPDGTYNFPFTYTLTYDKVIGMSVDYPLVIHNQLMDPKYIGNPFPGGEPLENPYGYKVYSSKGLTPLRELFLTQHLGPRRIGGVRIPSYDDWYPSRIPDRTTTLATVLLQVNPADLNEVIDLTQINGLTLQPLIAQYIATQGAKLGQLRESAVHVELYRNGSWMGDEAIAVDSTLKVRSTQPLCLRDRYHLRLSMVDDLLWLTDSARLDLRKQGESTQQILLTLQARMLYGQYVPKLQGPGVMPDKYYRESALRINQNKRGFYNGMEHQMLTVGYFFVTAHRMNSYAADAQPGSLPGHDNPATSIHYERILPRHCEPAAGCVEPRPF